MRPVDRRVLTHFERKVKQGIRKTGHFLTETVPTPERRPVNKIHEARLLLW